MNPIIIDPQFVRDIVNESKPALLTISKQSFVFSSKATKLLALKKGDHISLILENGKLKLKYQVSDGFKVTNINGKGCACIPVSGILIALKKHINVSAKSLKFEIGEFKDGLWPLIPSDGETASVK